VSAQLHEFTVIHTKPGISSWQRFHLFAEDAEKAKEIFARAEPKCCVGWVVSGYSDFGQEELP